MRAVLKRACCVSGNCVVCTSGLFGDASRQEFHDNLARNAQEMVAKVAAGELDGIQLHQQSTTTTTAAKDRDLQERFGNRYRVCAVCTGETNRLCGSCVSVYYCSITCQRKDRRAHKQVCVNKFI